MTDDTNPPSGPDDVPPGDVPPAGDVPPSDGPAAPPPPGPEYTTPPPPPGSGYGYAPPPPPPGAYGQQPPAYSPGAAFNYGWVKFQQNMGPIVLAALAILVGVLVIELVGMAVSGAVTGTSGLNIDSAGNLSYNRGHATLGFLVSMLFGVAAMVLMFAVQAGIIRGALDITYGRRVTLSAMFQGLNLVQVVLTALILAVATTIGFVLCILPGIVVAFFTAYSLYFVVDKQLPALEAIKASVTLVNRNLGSLVGFFLGAILVYLIGLVLCGIGLLAAIPVIMIAQAYTYRTLQGEAVAP